MKDAILKIQTQILALVTKQYPQVYLVGGTAIKLLYNHRSSDDLDFFTQNYTQKLHRNIANYIKDNTRFAFDLRDEEKRKNFLPMAVYEFKAGKNLILKIDFAKDVARLIHPPQKNGISSIDDLYYRKILTVIGWKAGESNVGKAVAGGRQKTKDLYDLFYMSTNVAPLSEWFPHHFGRPEYERLADWVFGIRRQKHLMELLDLVPGCDTKGIFKHLEEEIIHKLNKEYVKT